MKSDRKKLIAKADKVFSEYIRKRDNYVCFVCGKQGSEKDGVMQCGHLFTRADYTVRWDEMNAWCQCRGCNFRHEYDWFPFYHAVLNHYHMDRLDYLTERRRDKKKLTNPDIEEIIKYYQDKLNELK
jgi:hypothetical protein